MNRWLIGLSSGSGLHGVDAALVEAQGLGLDLRLSLKHFHHQPYPADVANWLLSANSIRPQQISILHRILGEVFAVAARQVAEKGVVSLNRVQCLGCSGHTFWHEPEGRYPSTLNLGMASIMAERTGLTVISDFRTRDLAAGGLGVPLTALIDYLLFHHPQENRALLHLGGIVTLLFLPAQAQLSLSVANRGLLPILGFHAAPGTFLLDGLVQRLTGGKENSDPGGKHAVQGRCQEPLLERWLAHPFFHKRPPRVLPLQDFGPEFINQAIAQVKQAQGDPRDLLCTAHHLVARAATLALKRFLPVSPTRVLLSGRGVRNGFLWHLLQQQLGPIPLEKISQHGIPEEARNPLSFAGLAALTLDSVPGNVSTVTGAAGSRLLGSLTPGSTSNWARCLAWMAHQAAPLAAAA